MSTRAIPDQVEPGVGSSWRVEGPQPLGAFLPEGVNDQLLHVSLELAAQLWVTRRRLAAIEDQLVAAGIVVNPDGRPPGADPEDHTDRDAFLRQVFGGLLS